MFDIKIFAVSLSNGEQKIALHRSLNTVQSLWNDLIQDDIEAILILHVGFSRPSFEGLGVLYSNFGGRVIYSDSAKHALPRKFRSSVSKIHESSDNLGFYLALDGWGYTIEDEPVDSQSSDSDYALPKSYLMPPQGWLCELNKEHSNYSDYLNRRGVFDDFTYVNFRSTHTSFPNRDEVDEFRFRTLYEEIDKNDPFQILKIAPAWFLDIPIANINLTVRLNNVFDRLRLNYVKDINSLNHSELMSQKNMGKKSLRDLAKCLISAVSHGACGESLKDRVQSCDIGLNLHDCLVNSLKDIKNDRNREIVEKRLGFHGEPETLEEIGSNCDLTRERVRQILNKNISIIIDKCSWDDLVSFKLNSILRGRQKPLYLELVEVEDDWFSGFSNNLLCLARVIEEFTDDEFQLHYYEDYRFISRLRRKELDGLLRSFSTVFEDCALKKTPLEEVKLLCQSILNQNNCSELLDLVFTHYKQSLQVGISDGIEKLLSFGSGIDQQVKLILEESQTPLHFTEIAEICIERLGRSVSVSSVHNLLGDSGYVAFNRGTYGLEKHLPLSKNQQNEVREVAESIIQNGSSGKQWHCTELVDKILEDLPELSDFLDHYLLNFILKSSPKLKYLKRMVWVSDADIGNVEITRIEYAQSFEKILADYGEPLSSEELKTLLFDSRGVHSTLQIHPTENMIRMKPGVWGLVERDVKLSQEFVSLCFNVLYEHLSDTKKAVHLSEIVDVLSDYGIDFPIHENDPYVLFSLSNFDERFKVASGDFLSLSKWTDTGRFNLTQAVHCVVKAMEQPMSLDEIYNEVVKLTEREVNRVHVTGQLIKHGATYSRAQSLWKPPEGEGQYDEIF